MGLFCYAHTAEDSSDTKRQAHADPQGILWVPDWKQRALPHVVPSVN